MIQEKILRDAGLPEEKIQRLKAAWSELESIKARPQRQIPCVVCAGIYNAGKSTLLNALTEQTDYFPTGNIPTTKEIKRLEYKGATYIDTPGLNADEGDDRETVKAYEDADYILFVSSAQDGGISQTESGWLRRMCERYTQEGFQRRLIYALSQCDQVEDDDFPAIRNQFAGDLEKSLGFAPEPIFRVDSATYADGKAQNETLLIDHSGIPQLQAYLAEKVADVRKLREAEQAELDTRRRETVEILADLYQQCKSAREKAVQDTQAKLAEVDKAWSAFEAELQKAMPDSDIKPISAPFFNYNNYSDYSDFSSSSKVGFFGGSSAKDNVRRALQEYYDKYTSIVEEMGQEAVDRASKYGYLSDGMNSVYFNICDRINKAFSNAYLSFMQCGIHVSAVNQTEIKADVDISSYLESSLVSEFVQAIHWKKSFSDYADSIRERYWDSGSRCDADGTRARDRLTKHIENDIEYGAGKANNRLIKEVWNPFRRKLNSQVESRKAELKQQVDAFREQLRRDAGDTSAASALSYLDTLAKEAQT